MKTYIISIPDAANETAVQAALAELLDKRLITLEPRVDELFSPVSEAEFADEIRTALASPVLSDDEARKGLDDRIAEADQQPRISFAEARQRLGLEP